MKMALASEEDLSAAYDLLGLIDNVERDYYPADENDEDAPTFLDIDDPEHLRLVYDRLKAIIDRRGSGAFHRVVGGFSTVRYAKNQILDLTKDTVQLHPRITAALTALDAGEVHESDDKVTVARMGYGSVAVGTCLSEETGEPGIIFMGLDDVGEIGRDTTDIYPVGSRPEANRVLAYVSFNTPAAVDQTISVLEELKVKYWPDTAPPSSEAIGGSVLEPRKLAVLYGSMPESNGKSNWTAILHRGDISEGHTIDRSEYPGRVRYEADRVRWLLGEIDKKPFILDYDADKHSGYVAPSPRQAATEPFQQRVQPWMLECFSAEIAADRVERNHRFYEESTETVQSNGMTRSEAHQLVDYTYDRPVGELKQEVGGVMVTLAALCLASGVDMHEAAEVELTRISSPETMTKIRAKQAAKPKHSPLPEAHARLTDDEVIEKSLRAVYGSCFTEQDVEFARALVKNARGES